MGQRLLIAWLETTRRRAGTVLVATGLVAALGIWLVSRVAFDANILRLLPQRAPAVRSFQTFLRTFGSLDHLYIVFESADAVAEHEDLVDAYVAALRRSPQVESVDAELLEPGKDWTYLSDRSLLLLGPDGAAEALARVRPPRVDAELAHARDLLSTPSKQVTELVQQDPLGWLTALRDRMDREKGLIAFDPLAKGYISADGHSRLVIVKPAGAPFDIDFCKTLFQTLAAVEREARAASQDTGGVPVQIQAAGAYRVSLESEQLIRRDAIINSVGSLVLLLVFVLVLFRTPWIMVYGFLPVVIGAVLALGVAGHLLGGLSAATSGSAGMLFGLGIDGIILLYLRHLEAPRTNGAVPTALLAGTAGSVILAQLTTAAPFLGRVFIDFPPLQELGALVGLGILFVCALTIALVPGWLARTRPPASRPPMRADRLGRFVVRRAAPIVWTGLAVTVVLCAAAFRLRIDTRIERLQTQTGGAQLERDVAARFSLPQDVLMVLNEGPAVDPLVEADTRLTAALAAEHPTIAVSGIGLLLPPARAQAATAEAIRTSGATEDVVRREVSAAADRAGFRAAAFEPFLGRLPRLLDVGQRITYEGLQEHGLDTFASRFLTRRDGRYIAVTYLYPRGPMDLAALRRTVASVDPNLQLTGLGVVNAELARRALPEFLKGVS
ncbi:MAG: MMPL family transporter, partial [Acidobacteriota bacterium]